MKPARASLLLAAAVMAGLLLPRRASAYVRYYTELQAPFAWAIPLVPITAYMRDFNQNSLTHDQVAEAVAAAAESWSESQHDCTYLTVQPLLSMDASPRAANDAHNALIFRSTSWCQLADDGHCEVEYDPSALAFTWDTANRTTGQIYDADIEVNLVDFQWADVVSDRSRANDMDLQNAITHEMGHLIGLDHTCYNPLSPGTTGPPVDNTGARVPDCNVASPDVQETTMYPSAMPGDTQKRSLAPDDVAGLCGIYPVAERPPGGRLTGGCARCAVSEQDSRPGDTALAGALVMAAVLRRRRA